MPVINVDHWPRASFVTVNHKRPDTWFCQYTVGKIKPNYPVPAIQLAVKYDYVGCINIDDVSDPADPIIVWMYDSWTQQNV